MLGIMLMMFLTIYFSSEWISINWLQANHLDLVLVERCIKLMGFMLAIRWFVGLHQGIIMGLEKQVWLNIYKIIINTLRFVGGLVLIMYISNDIFHFFMYQTLIAIIEFLVLRNEVYKNLFSRKVIKSSLTELKRIMPFALSIAFTTLIGVVYAQFDKLLLSHYLPLKEYGYLALVVAIQGAIMQFSGPLSKAVLPRMVSLLSNDKKDDMLILYRNSTRFISIMVSSIVGMIVAFSYELLFSWSGDMEASLWASPILSWYALGNAIFAITIFQYFLQYTYGELKYQNRFNMITPLFIIPIIFYAVSHYGAYGAGIAWFLIQALTFLFWSPFIHKKFAPNIHKHWLFYDILPPILITTIYLYCIKQLNINFAEYSRIEIFLILMIFGVILLMINSFIYKDIRAIFYTKVLKFKMRKA
jgi:O-antigen/teichoic acid export membrane protein